MRKEKSLIGRIDWITILLYFALVLFGWVNIYAAVFNENHASILDTQEQYGKQLIWILTSVVLIGIILLTDARIYVNLSYPVYIATMLLLVAVIFVGKEVGGNKSWIEFGSFSLQPSEFAKFGTALALARYASGLQVNIAQWRYRWFAILLIFIPIILILKQPDAGSAIVFTSFILVLYREGLPGYYIFLGIVVATLVVLSLIFLPLYVFIGLSILSLLSWLFVRRIKGSTLFLIGLFAMGTITIFGTSYVFENVLMPHQQSRINILLGRESDPTGVGYHTTQSLIAIGSGGLTGKGFLNGTQTKFDFVPEQSTDYIFCTVGEEWGFVGSFITVILFVLLLSRLVILAERQKNTFARVYGYGVISVIFIHFAVNIAMTIGLAPVIGIPLPFFSYGGSSLWGFTALLFIFIKLDSYRWETL